MSSPLTCGNLTSKIKQQGVSGRVDAKNSCAEVNASTWKPTERIRLLTAPRIDASSSTTKTIGFVSSRGSRRHNFSCAHTAKSWPFRELLLPRFLFKSELYPRRRPIASKGPIDGVIGRRVVDSWTLLGSVRQACVG